MADVPIGEVELWVARHGSIKRLVDAAAGVANALHVGLGPCIAGTLMEQELRDALNLKKGELVNIPKQHSARGDGNG